jgi:hypothetical protein
MLRGELRNRGADARCEASGEPFPCPIGTAIYDAVVTERKLRRDEAKESLRRAANYLKWWRDGAIDARTTPPDDINDVIVNLERLVVEFSPDEAQPLEPPPR